MTYDQFVAKLDARGVFRIHPDLDRIRNVLNVLGNPQNQYPTIHIAGTNGKGSVAAGLESVLRHGRYKTGLYTSPHLVDLRERIQIGGHPLHQGFMRAASAVLEAESSCQLELTHFELLTAVAFQAFAMQKVDIAVIECGMGGLWDATNVISNPLVSVITSIGLDHTDWLGKTEFEIARQKAGIMKPHGTVVSGVRGPAAGVIQETAIHQKARLLQLGSDFKAKALTSSWRSGKQVLRYQAKAKRPIRISFGLLGEHQVDNAALILTTLDQLKLLGWSLSPQQIDSGMNRVRWPGRLQMVYRPGHPAVLIDGAHNPAGVKTLLRSIQSGFFKMRPKALVFSAYKDKDFASMASLISTLDCPVYVAPLAGERRVDAAHLKAAFGSHRKPVYACRTPALALKKAMLDLPSRGVVIAAGSLSLAGALLVALQTARDGVGKESVHV